MCRGHLVVIMLLLEVTHGCLLLVEGGLQISQLQFERMHQLLLLREAGISLDNA